MNDEGDDRRLALEQGVGAAAPDAEVARALKADHAARLQPLDPSLWADIGLHVLRSIPENRLLPTAGGVAFFALMGVVTATMARFHSMGKMAHDDLVLPATSFPLRLSGTPFGCMCVSRSAIATSKICSLNVGWMSPTKGCGDGF
jgi:hypothetical protein